MTIPLAEIILHLSEVDDDTETKEANDVTDIDRRHTGRQMRGTKPLWVVTPLHAAAKHEAVRRETTLGEISHLAMCSYLNLDPATLEPLGIRAAS